MYSSNAHRMTVAADVRRCRAIAAIRSRCPLPKVIVRRSAPRERVYFEVFTISHHTGAYITIVVTAGIQSQGFRQTNSADGSSGSLEVWLVMREPV